MNSLERFMNQSNEQEQTVQDNVVVSMDYELTVDGEVTDKSQPGDPLQYIHGVGQLIPGLEKEMYGMKVGESKEVVVSPEDGYGEEDEAAYADIPSSEFPDNIPLEEGVTILLRDEDGNEQGATIVSVKDGVVRLNLNHPLAGKDLHFKVTVTDLRPATPEELDHQHVH